MFKIGQTVICVDSYGVKMGKCKPLILLQHLKEYIVKDVSDCFVKLEGVKDEWHETRFVVAEEIVWVMTTLN